MVVPHPLEPGFARGSLVDPLVRELDRRDESILVVTKILLFLKGPGDLFVPGGHPEEAHDGLHGHLARNFAGGMAAHAVGHQVQTLFGQQSEVVLVVRALHAHVGKAGVA